MYISYMYNDGQNNGQNKLYFRCSFVKQNIFKDPIRLS